MSVLGSRLYDFNSMLICSVATINPLMSSKGLRVRGDPNPTGFYSKKAPFNYERWADDRTKNFAEALSS